MNKKTKTSFNNFYFEREGEIKSMDHDKICSLLLRKKNYAQIIKKLNLINLNYLVFCTNVYNTYVENVFSVSNYYGSEEKEYDLPKELWNFKDKEIKIDYETISFKPILEFHLSKNYGTGGFIDIYYTGNEFNIKLNNIKKETKKYELHCKVSIPSILIEVKSYEPKLGEIVREINYYKYLVRSKGLGNCKFVVVYPVENLELKKDIQSQGIYVFNSNDLLLVE